jgi:hypothetical protein
VEVEVEAVPLNLVVGLVKLAALEEVVVMDSEVRALLPQQILERHQLDMLLQVH